MNFTEIEFWKWALAALAVAAVLLAALRLLRLYRPAMDRLAILALSLLLLGVSSLETLGVFLLVSMGTYGFLSVVTRGPDAGEQAKKWLWLLIPVQFLPLIFYKYSWFLLGAGVASRFDLLRDLVIPLGLSFYTFQVVSFSIDTLKRGLPMPGFLDYMNYASFFPQIVAGPIERRDHLLPQMERFRLKWDAAALNEGCAWIVLGLFLKLCLADWLNAVRHDGVPGSAWLQWHDNVAFGFQIYYDFCGYSLIALGIARCFGVKLALNFAAPYVRTSMAEFWRGWHISLTSWFKDYIYIPLGGSRTRWWFLVTLLVFSVSGFWHGAGWNFILWGGLNGLFLAVGRFVFPRLPAWLSWGLTMVLVFFCWMFFYETNMPSLFARVELIANPAAYTGSGLAALWEESLRGEQSLWLLVAAVTLAEAFAVWKNRPPYHYLTKPWVCGVLLFLLVFFVHFMEKAPNEFIYFAF